MEIFPVTVATILPPARAPYLEYPVFFAASGTYKVELVTSPMLDAVAVRKPGIGISVDDQAPEITYVFTPETTKDQTNLARGVEFNDRNNARIMTFTLNVDVPGRHVLKLTMVDPTTVVEKIHRSQPRTPLLLLRPSQHSTQHLSCPGMPKRDGYNGLTPLKAES